MKEKVALFIACILIGFVFGLILYFMDLTNSYKELIMQALVFGIGMFLFEIFIRPLINQYFKKEEKISWQLL